MLVRPQLDRDRADGRDVIREIEAVGKGQVGAVEQVDTQFPLGRRAERDVQYGRADQAHRRCGKQFMNEAAEE